MKKINNLDQLQNYQKKEAYDKFQKQFEYKKFLSMKKLSESLEDPYSMKNNTAQPSQAKKKPTKNEKRLKRTALQKIFKTNQRVQKFKNMENQKLIRILERMDLDKPILMHDKLDIIWDGKVGVGDE